MKSKIVCEQYEVASKTYRYEVVALTNRTSPKIGAVLKEEELQKLMTEATVEIKPPSKKRK